MYIINLLLSLFYVNSFMYDYSDTHIKLQNWTSFNLSYSIVKNKHTPIFNPSIQIEDLVDMIISEYNLPGISLNLIRDDVILSNKPQKEDGLNTISFHPDYSYGETNFYGENILKIEEFDIKINSNSYTNPESLYIILLHEFGHVYGLKHPNTKQDTVMGYSVLLKNEKVVPIFQYVTLTKLDLKSLYFHEIIFRTSFIDKIQKKEEKMAEIFDYYPNTITEQISCLPVEDREYIFYLKLIKEFHNYLDGKYMLTIN